MPHVERIHEHPFIEHHDLFVLECDAFAEIIPNLQLDSRHFVSLLVADFSAVSQDELVALSESMIQSGSRYFCAWGNRCQSAHGAFDVACSAFEPDGAAVIMTTDHRDDPIEEAIWYLLNCAQPVDPYDRDCHATIAICVNATGSAQTIRRAFRNPVEFSDNHGPTVDEAP
ncbi:MAG: DUF7684 family protein [Planctomycetota bacterium]